MVDICCILLLSGGLLAIVPILVLTAAWYWLKFRIRRKMKERVTFKQKNDGVQVVNIGKDGIREKHNQKTGVIAERPREVPVPPGRRGFSRFMYSSVTYSSGDGKRWGKVVVREKDGERTVEKYGDLADGKDRNIDRKKEDGEYVDVEASDVET